MNVYQIVTDRIIAELEKGIIPWERPWTGVRDGAFSRATGKPYSLLNQLLLGKPGEYLTYRQALVAGGQVRKGEKGGKWGYSLLRACLGRGDHCEVD